MFSQPYQVRYEAEKEDYNRKLAEYKRTHGGAPDGGDHHAAGADSAEAEAEPDAEPEAEEDHTPKKEHKKEHKKKHKKSHKKSKHHDSGEGEEEE